MIIAATVVISCAGQASDSSVTDVSLAAEPTCRLHGWVNDSVTLLGIVNASVIAMQFDYGFWYNTTQTNETGHYEILVPRGLVAVQSSATGYLPFTTEVDTTGQSEFRLDMGLEAEPTVPSAYLTLEPMTNVSAHNYLDVHVVAEDFNILIIELLIGNIHNRSGDWINITIVDVAVATPDPYTSFDDFEYTYEDDVFDGNFEWRATRDNAGFLENESTREYVTMNAQRSYNDDVDNGIASYYSNDTVEMEEGIAWFDNSTGEYEGFEFFNWTSGDYVDIPEASPDDPAGEITPIQNIIQWRLNSSSIEDIYAITLADRNVLDTRSVSGLTFEYYDIAPSGEYVAILIVIDEASNINWTEGLFTIDTDPPIADAGADRTAMPGDNVRFCGTDSSDNVGIINYTWTIEVDQLGGTEEIYGSEPTYIFEESGYHGVTLTVTDGGLNTGIDRLIILIGEDQPPVAEAGPSAIWVPEDFPVTFDGTGSSDDLKVENYSWEIVELGESSTEPVFAYTFDTPGVYHVELTVVDSSGQTSGPDSITVTVTDETDPTAYAGEDLYVQAGETVVLDGSNSSDNVGIASYSWSCDDIEVWDGSGETVERVFDSEGTYNITLKVLDAAGNWDSDVVTVHVSPGNEPPLADAGDDLEVEQGDMVILDAGDSSDDSGIENYTWTFEYDGETVQLYGEETEFTFDIGGSYEVNLTVTDGSGLTGYDDMTVVVSEKTTITEYLPYAAVALAVLAGAAVAAALLMRRKKSGA